MSDRKVQVGDRIHVLFPYWRDVKNQIVPAGTTGVVCELVEEYESYNVMNWTTDAGVLVEDCPMKPGMTVVRIIPASFDQLLLQAFNGELP